jgi:hypothetical protein
VIRVIKDGRFSLQLIPSMTYALPSLNSGSTPWTILPGAGRFFRTLPTLVSS